jgi:N-dimethylarginine dimethylaminohydrolase
MTDHLGVTHIMTIAQPAHDNLPPNYLICAPDFFEVSYIINPWMRPAEWAQDAEALHKKAQQQWSALRGTMQDLGWGIQQIAPAKGLPDMVFTANHAFVLGKTALIARFASKERTGESPLAATWFAEQGFRVVQAQEMFEGGGDALYDPALDLIFLGHGFRSQLPAAMEIQGLFQKRVVPLQLVDERFYHLDTCFCPLLNGYAMATPLAFNEQGLDTLKDIYGDKLLLVDDQAAAAFACNAVVHGQDIVMPIITNTLRAALQNLGFTLHELPLDSFLMAGGASRCLTLKLTD